MDTTTLEQSKQLYELGVGQNSEKYWLEFRVSIGEAGMTWKKKIADEKEIDGIPHGEIPKSKRFCSAFNASELLEILPFTLEGYYEEGSLRLYKEASGYFTEYCNGGFDNPRSKGDTPAQALGNLLTVLLEKGFKV